MDIFDFALEMEKEGEKYYREIAQKCEDKGLKSILNMLADDESKHYQILEKMKAKKKPEIRKTEILNNAKNIFIQLQEEETAFNVDIGYIELYKKAQKIERKRCRNYLYHTSNE